MTDIIQKNDAIVEILKNQYCLKSDGLLIKLLKEKAQNPKKSMWGAAGKMSMMEILKDLRDESD